MARVVLLGLALTLLMAGCGPGVARDRGAGVKQRTVALGPGSPDVRFQPCGMEFDPRGEGYDAVARDCLWQAFNRREPAAFATIIYTDAEDPLIYRVHVFPSGEVELSLDSRDRFGTRGVFTFICQRMERIDYKIDSDSTRYRFRLNGCKENELNADRVDIP